MRRVLMFNKEFEGCGLCRNPFRIFIWMTPLADNRFSLVEQLAVLCVARKYVRCPNLDLLDKKIANITIGKSRGTPTLGPEGLNRTTTLRPPLSLGSSETLDLPTLPRCFDAELKLLSAKGVQFNKCQVLHPCVQR